MWKLVYTIHSHYRDYHDNDATDLIDVEIIEASTEEAALQQLFKEIPHSMVAASASEYMNSYEEVKIIALHEIKQSVVPPSIEHCAEFQKRVAAVREQMEKDKARVEAVILARKEESERETYERLKKKFGTTDLYPEPCTAILFHGPGHQSRKKCQLKGPHDIHETRYGSYNQFARWKGDTVCTGFLDEPPEDPEGDKS